MTVNGTVSLCWNSVDSSLAKMVAPSDSGSFEVVISRHSGRVAGSSTGFSLGKRMLVFLLSSMGFTVLPLQRDLLGLYASTEVL